MHGDSERNTEQPAVLFARQPLGNRVWWHALDHSRTLQAGRSAACDIQLDDPQISRQHAEFFFRDGAFYVADLQAINGTRLNGKLLTEPQPLRDGDDITIAWTKIGFAQGASAHEIMTATKATFSSLSAPDLGLEGQLQQLLGDGVDFSLVLFGRKDDEVNPSRSLPQAVRALSSHVAGASHGAHGELHYVILPAVDPSEAKGQCEKHLGQLGEPRTRVGIAPSSSRALGEARAALQAAIASRDVQVAIFGQAVVGGRRRNSHAPRFALSWVHLSDLHFGAGGVSWTPDLRRVSRAIASDARNIPVPPDRIFFTGDIAFSGQRAEFGNARSWLSEVVQACGASEDAIRCVPGNHDVRRDQGDLVQRAIHGFLRVNAAQLEIYAADAPVQKVLGRKWKDYQEFVRTFGGAHPVAADGSLEWFEKVEIAGVGMVHIAGLSTVMVSDAADAGPSSPRDRAEGNMLVSETQVEAALESCREDELLLLLSHHPRSWLHEPSAAILGTVLSKLHHVHLAGHMHQADAVSAARLGAGTSDVVFSSGAGHAGRGEDVAHFYSWGALRYTDDGWEVGWAPRVYVKSRNEMRSDSVNHNLDAHGYAWTPIKVPFMTPRDRESTADATVTLPVKP